MNAATAQRRLARQPPDVEGAIRMMERIAKGGNRAAEIVARTRAMAKTARKSAADNHNALILERRFSGGWFLLVRTVLIPVRLNPATRDKFFGTEVEFGAGADEVVFPPPVVSLPLVRRDNYLNNLLRRYADEALARRPRQHGRIRSAVEDTVPQLLPHGKPSVSEVARRLGMSTRTLSRKLNAEGTAFADILDQLRSALAQDYLSERGLPISEIARPLGLGYCEVSSFTHAFKRWTGKTPRQFRSEETPS
jgi:AraC-like DNA-binding protein